MWCLICGPDLQLECPRPQLGIGRVRERMGPEDKEGTGADRYGLNTTERACRALS